MAKSAADLLSDIERRHKAIKKHWLDHADKIVDIYEAEDEERVPFNILYSNTETLLPALYNSTPRPEVARRFTTPGPSKAIDTAVAAVGERLLEFSADSNVGEYQTFDQATREVVLHALVAGQGVARVRYKEEDGYQETCYDTIARDRFVWAYARKWTDVPWVAFGYDLNKNDFEAQFSTFKSKKAYTDFKWEENPEDEEAEAKRREESGTRKEPTVLVWEVWNSNQKTISFVSPAFKEEYVKQEDYPFALTTRFPTPEPLCLIKRNSNLMPVPPYKLYEKQAQELNEVTRRLHLVLKAIKVRGGYNATLTELSTIMESDDTTLVAVENASIIAESGGFDKHIWFVPIADLIAVARELYQAQISCKGTIYEIMGIGDILRGQSQASETAAAQEIKNQWGSLRVKRMQKDVMVYCRELFRITFEFAANLYTPDTLRQITKLPYLTQGMKAQAKAAQQQMQQQAAMAQQQGQPPPSLPPEILLGLSLPTWEEITEVLRDRFERTYRIDVETNSTVDLEATEDKAQIAEFMNAWGQMMSGLTPLIESGAMPFEAAKLIMGEVFRRFRFARRVEQALDLIQQPQSKEDPKVKEEKHQLELTKVQAEAKRTVGEMQETVIEMTAKAEGLKLENANLKSAQDLKDQKVRVDSALSKHQIQSDYRGKVDLMKGEISKMQDQSMIAQAQKMLNDVQQAVQAFKQEQAAQQKVAAVKAEAPAQVAEQVQLALSALAENQTAMMEAIRQVAAVAGADREAELFVGPDGKKRSRSRIVLQ